MVVQVRLHEDARRAFESLTPKQREKLMRWKLRLQSDPTAGDQVRQRRIPHRLRRSYGLTNLWRLPLLDGWRVLYTIATSPERGTAVIVVWIGDHGGYDRLMGYATS